MFSLKLAFAVLAAAVAVHGYKNNCDGSFFQPPVSDCHAAIANVNAGLSYSDQAQFSSGECYLIYATNGSGPEPVAGQVLIDTANAILSQCGGHGSFGTNNAGCSNCHVTVNYRAAP